MKLYKYRPLNPYTLKLIKSGQLWFSNLDTLNDPFEADYYYSDDVVKQQTNESAFKKGPDILGRVTRYLDLDRHVLRRQFYVLSLSRVHDDILMWSHYAEQHNGVVVEIEMPEKPEHLGGEKHPGLIAINDNILQPVNYSGEPVDYNPTGLDEDKYSKVITSKTKQWDYEKEVRVIIHDKDARSDGITVNINPPMIKTVYFGMRCTPSIVDETIRAIDRKDIVYKRMLMKHGYFSLIAVEA